MTFTRREGEKGVAEQANPESFGEEVNLGKKTPTKFTKHSTVFVVLMEKIKYPAIVNSNNRKAKKALPWNSWFFFSSRD